MVTVPFVRSRVTSIHPEHQQHVSHVGHRKAPDQFPLDALKHFAVFTEQQNVVDIKSQDVDGAALGVDVDTGVRLEALETDLHHVFVDRAIPAPWALPETIETFEKPHYRWISVVTEFRVSGCHFNVNFLFDFGMQKNGVVIELPALKVELRRYRQHHTDALKPADRSKRASAVDTWYLSPSEHDDSPLVGFVSLDLVHPTRADDLVAG